MAGDTSDLAVGQGARKVVDDDHFRTDSSLAMVTGQEIGVDPGRQLSPGRKSPSANRDNSSKRDKAVGWFGWISEGGKDGQKMV